MATVVAVCTCGSSTMSNGTFTAAPGVANKSTCPHNTSGHNYTVGTFYFAK